MELHRPSLERTLVNNDGSVLHLLQVPAGDRMALVQLVGGVESEIAQGARRQLLDMADEHSRVLVQSGFHPRKLDMPTFEAFPFAVALAKRLSFTGVYEGYDISPWSTWNGVRSLTGVYEYGLHGLKLYARPSIPAARLARRAEV